MKGKTKVCVLGIWHLGSVYSACLADLGYSVTGWDKDVKKVKQLNKGIPPLFEPDLEELIIKNLASQNLLYTTGLERALKGASYVLLTIDTPVDTEDRVDLSPIFEISSGMAKYLEQDSIIIVSSQVPIGTCEQIKSMIRQQNPSLDFDIAYCPENLRLGQAIECFKKPELIVIGADNPLTLQKVEEFLAPINAPKVRMDLKSAEMTKHALNTFLGMCISFTNEIANLSDRLGADAVKVADALHLDGRIGKNAPLKPGLGFAGGTLARDLKVLQNVGDKQNYDTHLIDAILKVNKQQNKVVVKKLVNIYGKLEDLTVGVLGLTYKPGTSTLRRSAAIEIIHELVSKGTTVKAYDPKASLEELQEHTEFQFCDDPYEVAQGSDALVIVTDWPQFRALNFELIKSKMKKPVLIDARNMLNGEELTQIGFSYLGIGRGR